jgi:hypothetical protein
MVKTKETIFLIICFVLIFSSFYFYFNAAKAKNELLLKEKQIEELQTNFSQKLKEYQSFISSLKGGEEKIISSKELLTFLELDDTDKLKYDNTSFDCTGFAFELYKRAKAAGLKVGIAELEFEKEARGHLLNVFQLSDKGIVFIDVTGNEKQTGYDKIGFVQKGKEYKSIIIPTKEEFTICNFKCSDLPNVNLQKKKYDFFSQEFLNNVEACTSIYNMCVEQFNDAVKLYNEGSKNYTYEELKRWQTNLEKLKEDFTINNTLILINSDIVKNIQIYW